MPAVPGRDPIRAIMTALESLAGPLELLVERSFPWASATFIGERHRMTLETGPLDADALADALVDLDIPLRKGFVADLTVAARVRTALGWRLEIEALAITED